MVESVDTRDLKSLGQNAYVGSTPTGGTLFLIVPEYSNYKV